MSKKTIIEDIAKMCNVCRDLGYIGALADEYYHDSTGSDIADEITAYITELFNAIKKSEPKNEWISVNEKPKDEKRTYLVQFDDGTMRSCRWTNANPFWTDLTTGWHWNTFDIPQYSKVVAWMDLEPYKDGDIDED